MPYKRHNFTVKRDHEEFLYKKNFPLNKLLGREIFMQRKRHGLESYAERSEKNRMVGEIFVLHHLESYSLNSGQGKGKSFPRARISEQPRRSASILEGYVQPQIYTIFPSFSVINKQAFWGVKMKIFQQYLSKNEESSL